MCVCVLGLIMIMMIVCRKRRVLSFEVGGARKSSQERTHTARFASRRVVTCLISESTVESLLPPNKFALMSFLFFGGDCVTIMCEMT